MENVNQKRIEGFRNVLLHWHNSDNFRTFPWKNETNPYRIWLSEIMLQQTKSEQVLPYYYKFLEKYPTITDLANAPEDEVFKLWEGLGYYSRCNNLLHTAKMIRDEYNGVFPKKYEEIIQLKGVGKYTAAAIASFAFNLPYAVLDGNVFRVLSRYLACNLPIDSAEGKKYLEHIAQHFLDKTKPAIYNQAIMDFGATVCTPKNPLCDICSLNKNCRACKQNIVHLLPVKSKSLQIKTRYFHYLLLKFEDKIFIRQRIEKDIWQQLYELYLIEKNNDKLQTKDWKILQPYVSSPPQMIHYSKQRLTHRIIESKFYVLNLTQIPDWLPLGSWIKPKEIINFAFPRNIVSFFENYNYF